MQLEHLTLDERFFCRIALKNRLVTEGALRAILQLHADLARRGNVKQVQLLCLDKGLVRARDVDRILRAQRRTQALRLDMLYARHLAALGRVDPAELRAVASERDYADRPLSERLLARGAIDAATHQAVVQSLHQDLSADERGYLLQLSRKGDLAGGPPDPRMLETQVGRTAPGARAAPGGAGGAPSPRSAAPPSRPSAPPFPPAHRRPPKAGVPGPTRAAPAKPAATPPPPVRLPAAPEASRRYPAPPPKRRPRRKELPAGERPGGAPLLQEDRAGHGHAAPPPLRESIADWLGQASMASDSKEDQDLLESAVDELDRLSSEDGAAVREGALRAFQRRYKKGRRGGKALEPEAGEGARRAVALAWGLSVLAVVITLAAVLWDLLSNG